MTSPQIKHLARRLDSLEKQTRQRKLPTLGFSAIDDGAIQSVDVDGNLQMIIGKQHDGTQTAAVISGPTPPQPSAPILTPQPGSMRIFWDGTFADVAEVAPMDFARVLVYAVPTADNAEPHALDRAHIVGQFNAATGGEVSALLNPGVEYDVYFATWTEAGKFSLPSGVSTATTGTASEGVPGPPGADGQSLYTWLKYADDAVGTGMSDDPTGKAYIGLAYNKTEIIEGSDPSAYSWTLIKGADGQDGQDGNPGPPGDDGQSLYTWVKYGTSSSGAGMSDDPTGRDYIGLAYNKTTATESSDPADYSWTLFKGADGQDGADAPLPDAPTSSPVPTTVVGPASVVVNYTPTLGDVVDLHLWIPPPLVEGQDGYDTPVGVTPDSTTLHTEEFPPGGFVYTDTTGTRLTAGYPVWVALQARNQTPPAAPASVWVESSAGAIDPEYLELLAGSIIAQRLQAETLSGVTISGSVLDILDAIYAEPGYMEVRAALVEAQSAIFADNVTRRGTNNFLEGRETAASGVTDPGTPPNISATWPTLQLEGGPAAVGMIADEVNQEVVVLHTPLAVSVFDINNGTQKRYLSGMADLLCTAYDICKHGDWYYVALTDFMDDRIRIWRYSALAADEGTRDASFEIDVLADSNQQNPQACGIASDGTELTFVWINQNQDYRFRRYNPDTGAITTGSTTLPGIKASGTGSIAGVDVSNVVYPAIDIQPYHQDRISWSDFMALTLDDSASRARPFGEILVAADNQRAIDAYGVMYTFSTGTENLGTREYAYSWYDSDPGGVGVGESLLSPPRFYLAPKGSYINMKTPLPPDDGSVDAPNTVRMYIDEQLQPPEYSTAELETGRTISGPYWSGIAPPQESAFDNRLSTIPGGYQSTAGDASGPLWEINGTGEGRMGPFSWDRSGNVLTSAERPGSLIFWPGPNVPAGTMECLGQAVSRPISAGGTTDTYKGVWDAIGTTWGAGDGFSTFNLPSTLNRMPRHHSTVGAKGGSDTVTMPDHEHFVGTLATTQPPEADDQSFASGGVNGNIENHTHNITGQTGKVVGTNPALSNIPSFFGIKVLIKL